MHNDFEFRNYRRSDLEALVELDEACFALPFRFSQRAMKRFVEAENAWARVVEEKGRLAAFCIVHREKAETEEVGYVVTIDVAEDFRGQGLGQKILTEGEEWVRSWQGGGMLLHVFVKNENAVRFYERMQYVQVGVQRGFYGYALDAAMYWKELG